MNDTPGRRSPHNPMTQTLDRLSGTPEHLLALGSHHPSQPSGIVGACSVCLSIFSIDGSRAALFVLFNRLNRNPEQLFANAKRFELASPNQVADMPF